MSKFRFLTVGIAATVVLLACSSLALAQTGVNQQTFVSAQGSDANNCTSKATPCLTFAGALSKTKPGGSVFVLTPIVLPAVSVDALCPGQSQAVCISNSVTIDGAADSGATQIDSPDASAPAFTINAPDTFSQITFKFLALNGGVLGGTPTGSDGIKFTNKGALTVERTFIYGFGNFGINFTSKASGAGLADLNFKAQLFVRDSRLTGNYVGGISMQNTAGGIAQASLDSVRMENSFTGVGYFGGPRSRGITRDSVASSNAFGGIFAQPGAGATTEINIINTMVAFNFIGISSGGSPGVSTVRVGNSQVLSNFSDGLRVEGGSCLISLTGNSVTGNGSGNVGLFNCGTVPTQ